MLSLEDALREVDMLAVDLRATMSLSKSSNRGPLALWNHSASRSATTFPDVITQEKAQNQLITIMNTSGWYSARFQASVQLGQFWGGLFRKPGNAVLYTPETCTIELMNALLAQRDGVPDYITRKAVVDDAYHLIQLSRSKRPLDVLACGMNNEVEEIRDLSYAYVRRLSENPHPDIRDYAIKTLHAQDMVDISHKTGLSSLFAYVPVGAKWVCGYLRRMTHRLPR